MARRVFVVAGLMVLGGSILSVAAQLFGLENTEWAFVIIFWLGLILAVPALVAVLITRSSASDNRRLGE